MGERVQLSSQNTQEILLIMQYIYILHLETDTLGIVWSKAYHSQLSARKGLNKALIEELSQGNDFKSGDQDTVLLRQGRLYIQEILIENE